MQWYWKLTLIIAILTSFLSVAFNVGVLCRSLHNYDMIKQISEQQVGMENELVSHLKRSE